MSGARTRAVHPGASPRSRLLGRLVPYAFISPWVFGFLAFIAGPMVFSLVMSFYDWPVVGEREYVGLANYRIMLTEDPDFWIAIKVTGKFALLFVPYNVVTALMLALLLHHCPRWSAFFRTCFYLPSVISGVALVTIWSWVYNHEYGLLNYILGLAGIDGPNWLNTTEWAMVAIVIASLWGLGTGMLIFLIGLKGIPRDLYDMAHISGVPPLMQFFFITLPLISPVMLFIIVTSVISAFQQLTLVLLLTDGGPLKSTYFFAKYIYDNAFSYFEMGYAAAASWIMFMLVAVLTIIVFRSTGAWVFYETEMSKKSR